MQKQQDEEKGADDISDIQIVQLGQVVTKKKWNPDNQSNFDTQSQMSKAYN